jgi:hypothetical protein
LLIEKGKELDPWLPFPQSGCSFAFGDEAKPMPIGALLHLWANDPRWRRPCVNCGGFGHNCCEVDHLIPLELGGSNDIKNLWPQPDGQETEGKKPGTFEKVVGDAEKDQLENELHRLVCTGRMSLADAQKCIASNWLTCWERYVVPLYGPKAAVTP